MTSPIQLALLTNQQPVSTNNNIRQGMNNGGIKAVANDGLSFADLIDFINPLHHIPIIGNLYRQLTGDTIDPAIRIAGGALFGGPIGVGLSIASVVIEKAVKDDKDAGTLPGDQDQNMLLDANRAAAKESSINSGREIVETVYGLKSVSRYKKPHVNNQNKPLDSNPMIAREFSPQPGKEIVETAYGLKSIPRSRPSIVVALGSGVEPLSANSIVNSESQDKS